MTNLYPTLECDDTFDSTQKNLYPELPSDDCADWENEQEMVGYLAFAAPSNHSSCVIPAVPDRATKMGALDKHLKQPQLFYDTFALCASEITACSRLGETPKGNTGLINLGNSCFMNAVLQALFHTSALVNLFGVKSVARHINVCNKNGMEGVVLGCFCALLNASWSGKYVAIRPSYFLEIFSSKVNAELMDGRQHDAQEFQLFLLDALHEETNKIVNRGLFTQDYSGANIAEDGSDFIARYRNYSNSIVSGIFNLIIVSEMRCRWNHTCVTFEPMNQISVELPCNSEFVTLQECLRLHFRSELLSDEKSRWKCSSCNMSQNALRSTRFWSLPSVLIVHLKRFLSNGNEFMKNEASIFFDISSLLDLAEYVHEKAIARSTLYSLYAVIVHDGRLNSGHYISFVKTHGSWLKFDDDRCLLVDAASVDMSGAFILYFERQNSASE